MSFEKTFPSVIFLCCLLLAGCQKPSYSDIQVGENGRRANQNKAQGSQSPIVPGPLPEGSVADASPSPTPAPVSPPAFFDSNTRQIIDLPRYPRSRILRMTFGPMNGIDAMVIQMYTRDT